VATPLATLTKKGKEERGGKRIEFSLKWFRSKSKRKRKCSFRNPRLACKREREKKKRRDHLVGERSYV